MKMNFPENCSGEQLLKGEVVTVLGIASRGHLLVEVKKSGKLIFFKIKFYFFNKLSSTGVMLSVPFQFLELVRSNPQFSTYPQAKK